MNRAELDRGRCAYCSKFLSEARGLQCGHSMCEECAGRAARYAWACKKEERADEAVYCPVCHQKTAVAELVADAEGEQAVTKARKEAAGKVLCDTEGCDEVAIKTCADCGNLCEAHDRAVHEVLDDHETEWLDGKTVPIENVEVADELGGVCDEHGVERKFKCERCEVLVCRKCCNTTHKGHTICAWEPQNNGVVLTREDEDRLNDFKLCFAEEIPKANGDPVEMKERLHKYCEDLIKHIKEEEERVCKEIDSYFEEGEAKNKGDIGIFMQEVDVLLDGAKRLGNASEGIRKAFKERCKSFICMMSDLEEDVLRAKTVSLDLDSSALVGQFFRVRVDDGRHDHRRRDEEEDAEEGYYRRNPAVRPKSPEYFGEERKEKDDRRVKAEKEDAAEGSEEEEEPRERYDERDRYDDRRYDERDRRHDDYQRDRYDDRRDRDYGSDRYRAGGRGDYYEPQRYEGRRSTGRDYEERQEERPARPVQAPPQAMRRGPVAGMPTGIPKTHKGIDMSLFFKKADTSSVDRHRK